MEFLNRKSELSRLERSLEGSGGWLAIVTGRRRIGKTRLLTEWISNTEGVYFVADQSAASVQREYLAQALSGRFPHFRDVRYPGWRALLDRLAADARQSGWQGPIVFDEFPYLVQADAALPSIFQNWIDHAAREAGMRVVISGSSQRMMQGLTLSRNAPLYGRASEVFVVAGLSPSLIGSALGIDDPLAMVRAWSLWGGIPRYWELAQPFGGKIDESVDALVLDPHGPLHDETAGLLMEELPPAMSLRPLLDVIGLGAHKVSEIAGRIEQPATSLARPLKRLIELGLLRRESPFGAAEKSGRRSLYKIADPFFRLWFRVVAPNRSAFAEAPRETRLQIWAAQRDGLYAEAWEELCRESVAFLHRRSASIGGPWLPAKRYWRGNDPEFDVVARSVDGRSLLLGEAKWSSEPFDGGSLAKLERELIAKGIPTIPGGSASEVVRVLFVPKCRGKVALQNAHVLTAEEVIASSAETEGSPGLPR